MGYEIEKEYAISRICKGENIFGRFYEATDQCTFAQEAPSTYKTSETIIDICELADPIDSDP